MRFEQESLGWTVHSDDADQLLNVERRQILESLSHYDGLTPAQIAEEAGQPPSAVRQLLKSMLADNQVEKKGHKYLTAAGYESVRAVGISRSWS